MLRCLSPEDEGGLPPLVHDVDRVALIREASHLKWVPGHALGRTNRPAHPRLVCPRRRGVEGQSPRRR